MAVTFMDSIQAMGGLLLLCTPLVVEGNVCQLDAVLCGYS